ncbi:STAS domain-containing protein [Streptomyces sp. NPDC058657]|uniref:STAS domain-containing protein n=1 Tax=unclassified Streptomyces TaxID=2593676 RepID=UPI003667E051
MNHHYRAPRHLVVVLADTVDLGNVCAVRRRLHAAVRDDDHRPVLVDVQCPLLTSTALGMLFAFQRVLHDEGRPLHLLVRHSLGLRVLQLTGLHAVFHVVAELPEPLGNPCVRGWG